MKRKLKPHTKLVLGLFSVDLLFFSLTDPLQVPSVLLIVAFLLFAVTFYQVMRQLFRLAHTYGVPVGAKATRLARIITGVIGVLIALQSMGQLSARDIWVLIPLALLTYLYVSYGQSNRELS
jgi:hypothetical protein